MAQGVGSGSPKKARAFCGAARARGPASSEMSPPHLRARASVAPTQMAGPQSA